MLFEMLIEYLYVDCSIKISLILNFDLEKDFVVLLPRIVSSFIESFIGKWLEFYQFPRYW